MKFVKSLLVIAVLAFAANNTITAQTVSTTDPTTTIQTSSIKVKGYPDNEEIH